MKRIGFTLLVLAVFHFLSFVPIPLINLDAIKSTLSGNTFFDFLNTFSGGALGRFSICALGISPYITASIVVQMLQMDIIPPLKEWGEEGETGKKKLNRLTRYIGMGLAFINALAILLGLSTAAGGSLIVSDAIDNTPIAFIYVYLALVVTAGTAIVMWLADLITRNGVGNGSSMIIAAGIISALPSSIVALVNQFIVEGSGTGDTIKFIVVILLYILIIAGVCYMEIAQRKIPVQYANRQGKSDSTLPIKINSAGVMPVIFASTLMSIPLTIAGITGKTADESQLVYWLNEIFSSTETIGFILYIVLIFVFSFFYTFLMTNPSKISENLSKSNAFIPGVRPGDETTDFISKILFKVTFIGTIYLTIIAILPIITTKIFDLPSSVSLGGTGLLIVVGVAVETVKQIENDSQEKSYQGFI